MTKAIRIVLFYIGIPCIIIGMILGSFMTANGNINKPVLYKLEEFCYGDDCKIYEEFVQFNDDLCKQLYDEDYYYIDNRCFQLDASQFKLANASYLQIMNALGDVEEGGHKIIDKFNEKLASEKSLIDAGFKSKAIIDELQQYKSMFEAAFPTSLFCNENLTYNYVDNIQVIEKTDIAGWKEQFDMYSPRQCAVCTFEGKGPLYNCKVNEDYWRADNKDEDMYCLMCDYTESGHYRQSCLDGYIEKTKSVSENKSINVNVGQVSINQSWTFDKKMKFTNFLRDASCKFFPFVDTYFDIAVSGGGGGSWDGGTIVITQTNASFIETIDIS